MVALSDPTSSQAVLVGVHTYAVLEDLTAVANNLRGLREVLTEPTVWGLPEDSCTVIEQPSRTDQVLDVVRERGRLAEDTLLVYYAGHGLTDPHTDELYLALANSDPEREYTSLRYEYLRRAVLDLGARARRTVVILDCCYSGRALLGRMSASAHIADQAAVEGTCLLTASAETRPALSPPGETYTAFTGELIGVLRDGIAQGPDPVDMDTLYRHVHRRLAARSRPLPQQRSRNTGGLIAIARNRSAPGSGGGADAEAAGAEPPDGETSDAAARRREAAERLAEMEEREERLRREAEELRREAEELRRAAETRLERTLQTVGRLAKAIAASPDGAFQPQWFAVPVSRPLFGEDGSLEPLAELRPGVWYLALGRRGDAWTVAASDGTRGLLLDTSGLQIGTNAGQPTPQPVVPDLKALPDETGPGPVETGRERALRNLWSTLSAVGVGTRPEPQYDPFWFAVPVPRPVRSEDGSGRIVAELMPGVWYLAVEQRGDSILVQTSDGRSGLLLDTTGIQRG
ncbi:caspase domain-containing protein [Streptomyces sp. MMS24-I2-30]|uniref:caspase family protein n=1 Tax=Streptomyces sp. MMS24-I2-30 TaxID=3351564 RepID=UPI0038968509